MKSIVKIVAVAVVLLVSGQVSAQKVAHINTAELTELMPEVKKMRMKLDTVRQAYEDKFMQMNEELQTKYKKYQVDGPTMSPAMREITEKELQDLQSRIQQFEQKAQEEIQAKNEELMKPIVDKIKDAIAAAAKEGGYGYVLDTSAGSVVYFHEADDLAVAVKKKLNITASAPATNTPKK